jgi:hypothetical protein
MKKTRTASPRRWNLYTIPEERQNITLLCRLNANNNGIYHFDIVPPFQKPRRIHYRFTDRAPFLARGRKLRNLSEFYSAAITFAALNADWQTTFLESQVQDRRKTEGTPDTHCVRLS